MTTNPSMRLPILGTLALLATALVAAAPEKPAPQPPQLRLALDLSDGSHVIGAPTVDGVDVDTTYGKAHLVWAAIRTIEWKAGEAAAEFSMTNGDKVTGRVSFEKFQLTTLVGPVTIAVGHVRKVTTIAAGGAGVPFSLQFDGKQNYVEVPNDPDLDPMGAMTLECWYKTETSRTTNILGKRQWRAGGLDHGYEFAINEGRIEGYWWPAILLGSKVSDGKWHHAALTWDGRVQRLFDDGRKVAEGTPKPWTPTETTFRIGAIDGFDLFLGSISQVRLSKIDRYGGQNFVPDTRFAADEGTVALWDFSEGSGTTLHDASGHGHDGKFVGNPPPQWVEGAPTAAPAK